MHGILILRALGMNCDAKTVFTLQQARQVISSTHVNQVIRGEERLSDYQIMVILGGFTYGDDVLRVRCSSENSAWDTGKRHKKERAIP